VAKIQKFEYKKNNSERIDKYISGLNFYTSRTKADEAIKCGLVKLNGKTVKKGSVKLSQGDLIEALPMEQEPLSLEPYEFPLDLVFEDQDLVVINKPAGIVMHPSNGHQTKTIVNALIARGTSLSEGSQEFRPGIVHRLDKDTSGLVVIAKNEQTHVKLAEYFKDREIKRSYLALSWGAAPFPEKIVESYLSRSPSNRKKIHSTKGPEGKYSKTHVETLRTYNKRMTLFKLTLSTGRTHQIRVHLSDLGFPIVGDFTYGRQQWLNKKEFSWLNEHLSKIDRFFLHAKELGFIHPTTGEEIYFTSPLPEELRFILTTLGETDDF
jgi:23S rRNA pseudouridine1911/1915/1917 synthase